MVLIFVGSTDVLSAEHTSRFIGPFLHWLDPTIPASTVLKIQLLVRKAGHVTEYAILALLLFRALANTILRGRPFLVVLLDLTACGVFAATDEFHQSFVPSRTASARDVMIDLAGAAIGVALYASWARKWRNLSLREKDRGPERI